MQTKKHIKKNKVVMWCKNVTTRSHHLYGADNCGHCCAIVVPLTTKPHFPVVILIDRSTVLSSLTSFTATRKLWSVIQAIHFLILHCDFKTLAHPVVAYKWYIVWFCTVMSRHWLIQSSPTSDTFFDSALWCQDTGSSSRRLQVIHCVIV